MAKVIMVCGSTGAGKTTFCKTIANQSPAMIFSIDEWMSDLFAQDVPPTQSFPWILERVARCENVIWKQCLKLNQQDVDVVLDIGFSTVQKRQAYYQKMKESGLSYELCFLDVPREVRLARVLARNKQKGPTFQFEVTESMFNHIESLFESPSLEELSMHYGRRVFNLN